MIASAVVIDFREQLLNKVQSFAALPVFLISRRFICFTREMQKILLIKLSINPSAKYSSSASLLLLLSSRMAIESKINFSEILSICKWFLSGKCFFHLPTPTALTDEIKR